MHFFELHLDCIPELRLDNCEFIAAHLASPKVDLQDQLSSRVLKIEPPKLTIVKLRRMQFGRKYGKLEREMSSFNCDLGIRRSTKVRRPWLT